MKNIEKAINKVISEYLIAYTETIQTKSGAHDIIILDNLDIDDLSTEITKAICSFGLKFKPLVQNVGCDSCKKQFGNWVNKHGIEIPPHIVEERKIIILEGLNWFEKVFLSVNKNK